MVNNYYYTTEAGTQNQTQEQTPATIIIKEVATQPVQQQEEAAPTPDVIDPSNNIRIEANGADVVFEVKDGVYSISINAEQASEPVQAITTAAPVEADAGQSVNWYEIIKIALLGALVVNVMRKPRTT